MNEMITIPKERYEALLEAEEDLADIQAYDEAKAKGGESYPSALVDRIIDGENPVTVFREYRGLSGAEAARRAGIHRVQLRDIESGKSRGSVDTLKAIAAALDVDLDLIA